jgi:hypothetical protein
MNDSPWNEAPDSGSLRDPHGRSIRRVPIQLTPSPDLVDLALAYVADGTISNPETPALLRRIAAEHLAAETAYAASVECPALPQLPITEGFVLVDCEIRPGVRGYRLARLPENVAWRIRVGAFERHVHRTLVILWRRLVRFLTAQMAFAPEAKARLLAHRTRAAGDVAFLGPASH